MKWADRPTAFLLCTAVWMKVCLQHTEGYWLVQRPLTTTYFTLQWPAITCELGWKRRLLKSHQRSPRQVLSVTAAAISDLIRPANQLGQGGLISTPFARGQRGARLVGVMRWRCALMCKQGLRGRGPGVKACGQGADSWDAPGAVWARHWPSTEPMSQAPSLIDIERESCQAASSK